MQALAFSRLTLATALSLLLSLAAIAWLPAAGIFPRWLAERAGLGRRRHGEPAAVP